MDHVILYLYRDCPWPRDYSEVIELYGKERMAYIHDLNKDHKTINGINVPGITILEDANIPTGALSFTATVEVDPSVGNHLTYCQVLADDSLWFYWIDAIEFLRKADNPTTVDLLQITCTTDIWAQYGNIMQLHDSFVERKTVKRWVGHKAAFYTSLEHAYGSHVMSDPRYIREYIEVRDKNGTVIYKPEDRKSWIYWCVIYVTHESYLRTALGGTLILDGEEKGFQCSKNDGTLHRVDIYPANNLARGNLLKYLDSAKTLVNCELIPYTGLCDNCYIELNPEDHRPPYLRTKNQDPIGVFQLSKGTPLEYWGIDRDYVDKNFYPHNISYTPLDYPKEPDRVPGTTYKEIYEPMLFQSPARTYAIVNSAGSIMGKFSDFAAWAWLSASQLAIDVLYDTTATTTNIMLSDGGFVDPEYIIRAASVGNVVSVAGYKGIVADDKQLQYRNNQYNADLRLKQSSQIRSAIQTGLSVGFGVASAGVGSIAGGPIGTAAGLSLGLMAGKSGTDAILGFAATEAEWEHKQTIIANEPNDILFSGGCKHPTESNALYALMELQLNSESYRGLQRTLYYKGIRINTMINGVIDLHERVGFDYIQCGMSRVYVPAPTNIQVALQDIFNKGVRIYHDKAFFEQRFKQGQSMTELLENYEYDTQEG